VRDPDPDQSEQNRRPASNDADPTIRVRPASSQPRKRLVDTVLRNRKLLRLHRWLERDAEEYCGIYDIGSVASGDPWIDGRSDRDIMIVFDGLLAPKFRERIAPRLPLLGFNDKYTFNLARKDGFLGTHSHYDIAIKFRGQVVYGDDLIAAKETPTREFAGSLGQAGLRAMTPRIQVRLLNARSWSLERLRHELYVYLKLMFLHLADRHYATTGIYPARRRQVADAYGSPELRRVAGQLRKIDQLDTQALIGIGQLAVSFLQKLPSEAD
jgi:hypothetical protein